MPRFSCNFLWNSLSSTEKELIINEILRMKSFQQHTARSVKIRYFTFNAYGKFEAVLQKGLTELNLGFR
jgi:hypothetical protein